MGEPIDDPEATVPASFTKAEKLQRARVVLLLEMGMHSFLFGIALLGGAMDSGIYRMYAEQSQTTPWVADPRWWALGVGTIALWGLLLAVVEWFVGEKWINADISTSCKMRAIASFCGMIAWLDLMMTVVGHLDQSKALFPLVYGPMGMFFYGVCFIFARRVIVILDPKKDTRHYEKKQADQRTHVATT